MDPSRSIRDHDPATRSVKRPVRLADWQMPEGVDTPLWHYVTTQRLAQSEADYFANHPLLDADRDWLLARWREPGPVLDLGCGTGRISLALARQGFAVTAIDLSQAMLVELQAQAQAEDLSISTIRANLARLSCLRPGSARYAALMFSTLGMIRTRRARIQALQETSRLLMPGGLLGLHAHNFWYSAQRPGSRIWLLRQILGLESGDRAMTYRGIFGLRIHSYRWGELRDDLESAGLAMVECRPICAVTAQPIRRPHWGQSFRAGGWLVMARRVAEP